jgi:protein-disulfide isomerase/uncharacterized membrane protein
LSTTSGANRLVAAFCLCLAGAMVSGLLLLQHHGEGGAVSAVNQVCGEGEAGAGSDCETVAQSPWSSIAGFPVAGIGLVFYASLTLLLALALLLPTAQRPWLAGIAIVGLVLGLLIDVLLLGVQALAIRAFCTLCIITYALSAGALFALLPARRDAPTLKVALGHAEFRLALAGWALGTLALVGAVFATEVALDYRQQGRQMALLGAPPPAPPAPTVEAPSPPETATHEATSEPEGEPADEQEPVAERAAEPAATADGHDAAYWEQRAKELQQTLDTPAKLQQYFAAKAQEEFEAAPVESIDTDGVPRRGPADAPVQVVEYSDFLCPFCRNLARALAQFVPQAGGRVAVYFKNYPLDKECNHALPRSTHPGSCQLALGALCAQYQGKFEAYHDRVFSAEGLHNPGPQDVVRLAGEAGLNPAAMESCLRDPETAAALAKQIAEAQRLKVRATPTVYINGKKLPRINDFVPTVDREAQKHGFPPLGQ